MKRLMVAVVVSTFLIVAAASSAVTATHEHTVGEVNRWADLATASLIDEYWSGANSPFLHFGWGNAQAWDAFLDAVERTGGTQSPYFDYVDQLFRRQSFINTTFINEFNDDMAWWALASLRAYDLTGDIKYFNRALLLWNTILRSWDDELGGGIWWRSDEKGGKNACINSPASIIAAKLYQLTGDPEYLEWAKRLYDWVKVNLAPTGLVWDNVNRDGDIWKATFTYNQGTYIGAAVELYNITGDPEYLEDARQTARLSMTRLVDANGILVDEGQGDGGGFKGILIRYLASLIGVDPEPEAYVNFLFTNARSVGEKGFNDRNLIGPNWAKQETGHVELLTHVSGVMLLNLTATTLAQEAAYGLTIVSPAWDTSVMAGEPIVVKWTANEDVAHVSVLENGVEVYRGDTLPTDLRLSTRIDEEGEQHTLTVKVTDTAGSVKQRSTRYRVRRLRLDVPELNFSRVEGELALGLGAAFGDNDRVSGFRLSLVPVSEFLGTEPIVLLDGDTLPETWTLDSTAYADGAYDLELVAKDRGGDPVSRVVHRVVIRNWDVLREPFRAPIELFGMKSDALLTEARSEGWVFHEGERDAFFGDVNRIEPVGDGVQYLIWHYPYLQRFALTMYVTDPQAANAITISISSDMAHWKEVSTEARVIDTSATGWLQMELAGDVDISDGAAYFKIEVDAPDAPGASVQLGELNLMRPIRVESGNL